MVDLETLSTRSWASILVIGAIKFNLDEPVIPLEKLSSENQFYRRITLESNREIGLHEDSETKKWWDTQPEEVRKEAFEGVRFPLKRVLEEFTAWFGKSTRLWCQGANFDAPILDEAYRRFGLTPPWKFWNVRDTRTLYFICGGNETTDKSNLHNALFDCQRQITAVKTGWKKVKS